MYKASLSSESHSASRPFPTRCTARVKYSAISSIKYNVYNILSIYLLCTAHYSLLTACYKLLTALAYYILCTTYY